MKVGGVGPVDVAAADSLERRIQRAVAAGSCRGKHGAASYQRGEQMAKGSVCVLVFGPLMSAPSQPSRLPRTLGLWSSVALVIGITIGSGIFRSPAGIAQKVPSPTLMLALWVVGGLVTL